MGQRTKGQCLASRQVMTMTTVGTCGVATPSIMAFARTNASLRQITPTCPKINHGRNSNMSWGRIIVGIDPGTQRVGYAIVAETEKNWQTVDSGVFQPPRSPLTTRLAVIFDELMALLSEHLADCLVVEEPHVRPWGMKSALVMAQSVGVIKLAAVKAGVPVVSYPYTQVKRVLTGSGAASREVLALAVQQLLNLPQLPPWQDAVDAMALALCHGLLSPLFSEVTTKE